MTSLSERQHVVSLIQAAHRQGARLARACEEAGLALRSYRRWVKDGVVQADKRPTAARPKPANSLSQGERELILTVCNRAEYANLPPCQIVADLLDKGAYIASEATFYRTLRQANQLHHRGRSRAPKPSHQPTTHHATGPRQVWCWDITYCPSRVRGQFYYLYLVEDIYSRKIVGYEVHETEDSALAAALLQRCVLSEGCLHQPLVLHSDNGAPMKAQTLRTKLEELSIKASYSRPRVSNDNPFVESLFRVMKYCPQWPSSGFVSLDDARAWVLRFVQWYNTVHRHSQLNYVTPQQRHEGKDREILAKRHKVLANAKRDNPMRWGSRAVRNCTPLGVVTLNPENDIKVKKAA